MKPIIRVENLSKQYTIGTRQASYGTLRDSLAGLLKSPFSRNGKTDENTIWALRDVSFDVMPGEVVGIIGRNGAGKSTLLKILSRIVEPTTGEVDLYGRVGSLLEVGTGFHVELSGRENIYLNGAILGMKRNEIDRKFDEIVDFAEIEKFIDTPVKHYSSGMYMRLAFAVAAHLDPEILIVDEVLAVGDVAFQKKCLAKMEDTSKEGRTILFVSHNLSAINRLCQKTIWLNHGIIHLVGRTDGVVSAYLLADTTFEGERFWEGEDQAPGNSKIRLRSVRVLGADRQLNANVDIRHPFYIEIAYEITKSMPDFRVAYRLMASDGCVIFTSNDISNGSGERERHDAGLYVSRCRIPGNLLNEGNYTLTVTADIPFVEVLFFEENVLSFFVEQTGGVSGKFQERWPGVICPDLPWAIERLE